MPSRFAATAPAWSQSLLKTLDPDNDGTVDLTEAKDAATKLFDKLDGDQGRHARQEGIARPPQRQGFRRRRTPTRTARSTRPEFLAVVEKRFTAADPDKDGTIDAKELKSAAGKSLAKLLK